ncbi:MAG: hypothetical protein ACP5RD_03970 [bacterium]
MNNKKIYIKTKKEEILSAIEEIKKLNKKKNLEIIIYLFFTWKYPITEMKFYNFIKSFESKLKTKLVRNHLSLINKTTLISFILPFSFYLFFHFY